MNAENLVQPSGWIMDRMQWLPMFLQNTNSDAKYYGGKAKSQKKITYLQVSEYSSVVPDIANSGLMDVEY